MKFRRILLPILRNTLERHKSVLLLGPRQVGKTTLLSELKSDYSVSLISRRIRLSFEKDPERLLDEIKALKKNLGRSPLVVLDEVQKVPDLLDVAQQAIDNDLAQFILTGSSARKLRRQKPVNLLPGRVVNLRLDPMVVDEGIDRTIEQLLLYGSLPGILLQKTDFARERDLRSYVESYLDEEVREEANVRRMGIFVRFLELAALESGNIINFSKIAEDIGVSPSTVQSYFEILEDCLVAERVSPLTRSDTRKKLTKSDKYLVFDLGVRRLAADEGERHTPERWGQLLEQFVGLELIRLCRAHHPEAKIRFWRDLDGPEVDWVIDVHSRYLPIEVKWTERPARKDARHLETFLDEYPNTFGQGFILCRAERPQQITERVTALSWKMLGEEWLGRALAWAGE